ncbi:MAG: GntR family transcriptional regulator [Bacillota bacterium]
MWLRVDPGRGVPIYLHVKDQIKNSVAGGVLAPGEQLPSVRDLALQLSINPNTISKAYQELEHEGVVYTLRGRGTFVAEPASTLSDLERSRRLDEAVEKLFLEAYHLRCKPEEILAAVRKKMRQRNIEEDDYPVIRRRHM